jgi:hypothetical protein
MKNELASLAGLTIQAQIMFYKQTNIDIWILPSMLIRY